MELVTINNNELQLNPEVLTKLQGFYEAKLQFDILQDQVKEAMLNAMQTNNIKSFENDFMKVSYIAPTTRKSIDTEALKAQGLYNSFIKESPVKASVRVSFK